MTDGRGVAAVNDSVGRDTFNASLDSLQPHGVLVSFGNASGPVEPFQPLELSRRGSLYVTRPTLFDFIRERSDLDSGSRELLDVVQEGQVEIRIDQHYPLADAAVAQAAMEGRKTTGSSVLLP
jgi:NADPH2:quinone reductase